LQSVTEETFSLIPIQKNLQAEELKSAFSRPGFITQNFQPAYTIYNIQYTISNLQPVCCCDDTGIANVGIREVVLYRATAYILITI
jgi:hypothetical protein